MNRKIFKLFIVCAATYMTNISAGDSGCAKCQMIREYNATHPQKEEYYEDYLKEHPKDRVNEKQDTKAQQVDVEEN